MRVLIKASMRLVPRTAQLILFAGGIGLLGYCGLVLVDAWTFQHREEQRFEQLLRNGQQARKLQAGEGSTQPSESPPSNPEVPAIGPDRSLGRIEIPRLGVSVVVVEGTGTPTLRRGAGHITGTAWPGQPGNIGIAGHRDTFFRPLRYVHRDDVITLTTLRGEYRYRVVSTKVVDPSNVAVLRPDRNEILTLVTCYPFYFVGFAPDRFIVRAERVF